jgi:hypothetical protein
MDIIWVRLIILMFFTMQNYVAWCSGDFAIMDDVSFDNW